MKVSQISFGRKIPRYTCQIQNKQTGEYVPATFYEYNCKDESDIDEVRNLDRRWAFRNNIANKMDIKHTVQTYFNQKSNDSFYSIQVGKEIIGLTHISTFNGVSNVNYITTKPRNEYKYAGQTMLACAGKELLKKNGHQMTVTTAIDDAYPFYSKVGFHEHGDHLYRMNRDDISTLIERTEFETDAPILDKKA
ncbi:MAG: GNAT family N-acetyltransferase [Candidatus Gastranaerophilales bacterium]|nr:GNAT family N-acetyltransferase [Candidatus Gastranaerophilales bacterium]